MYEIAILILGLLFGGAAGLYLGQLRGRGRHEVEAATLNATLAATRDQLAERERQLEAARQALEVEKVAGAATRERLEGAREHFAEQRKQIDDMQAKVKETFAALSATALKSSNEQFLTLAETRLKPVRELMERYEKQIKELEEARAKAYGGLTERLDDMKQGAEALKSQATQLVAALRSPGAKGKWGEVTLQRIVELAGLTEHCDFTTQDLLASGQRPDLVVRLPNERCLAIDSKVNTSAYLDAVSAGSEAEREACLDRFHGEVRSTMKRLAAKEYWKQLSPAPEFVVMFMPGEAFFAAAVARDPDLLLNGVQDGVLLASPTTLIALLMAVRHGWQQQQVAENAERIAEAGRELYERLCTFADHLEAIRSGLAKAAEAYNRAMGTWSSRALVSAKRLKELGAAEAGKEIGEAQDMDVPLRALPAISEHEEGGQRRAI
jgi:DNA recombination protein RmuC